VLGFKAPPDPPVWFGAVGGSFRTGGEGKENFPTSGIGSQPAPFYASLVIPRARKEKGKGGRGKKRRVSSHIPHLVCCSWDREPRRKGRGKEKKKIPADQLSESRHLDRNQVGNQEEKGGKNVGRRTFSSIREALLAQS